ncbi:Uncharacterised protein r2_g122 [Pycnogonum litorale]
MKIVLVLTVTFALVRGTYYGTHQGQFPIFAPTSMPYKFLYGFKGKYWNPGSRSVILDSSRFVAGGFGLVSGFLRDVTNTASRNGFNVVIENQNPGGLTVSNPSAVKIILIPKTARSFAPQKHGRGYVYSYFHRAQRPMSKYYRRRMLPYRGW